MKFRYHIIDPKVYGRSSVWDLPEPVWRALREEKEWDLVVGMDFGFSALSSLNPTRGKPAAWWLLNEWRDLYAEERAKARGE